ncbi:MAG: PocR ligand-binding domain-containing protein [Eubacteriales bacterium]|nr:PocR ligand-binding domain-containing protein [Clostridia bacterium]MDZ4042608.1 PocR ligand-binding domain-containing protein [Eubacteriales bacterium]MDZ7610761.1 PocR ligand-binding domain-containing protein [Eubacteriales bacterium]
MSGFEGRSLQDLIDPSILQQLQDDFSAAAGIATSILDTQGMVVTHSGWSDLCLNYHRLSPAGAARCWESDRRIVGEVGHRQREVLRVCHNGLAVAATPIMVSGCHVATLAVSQVFLSPPNETRFRFQARQLGFDEEAYLEAVRRVRIIPESQLLMFARFFTNLTGLISRFGQQSIEHTTLKRERERLIAELEALNEQIAGANQGLIAANQAMVVSNNELMRAKDKLNYLSAHDPLTGLYNRIRFEDEMRRLERGRHDRVGIIVCDVDGLKLINDTLGHEAGDGLLSAAAGIIQSTFRDGDIVSRIGGDEFAVVLPSAPEAVIESACRKIRDRVTAYNHSHTELPLSMSVGFAIGDTSGPVTINDLFKEADNNMYREKLHRSMSARSAIVQTLMKALEARDFVTEGHADRLQTLVVRVAIVLGMPEHQVSDLRLLAQFHDIGKVGIPDRILFKPASLMPEETSEMRRHCEIGHRIALSAPDMIPIADWILKHHEWWNGQGYPLGLQGEGIPLECRILAVVDAYDAMTNDRPYRPAMPHETATDELLRCAGTQFDPLVVEKFVQLFPVH